MPTEMAAASQLWLTAKQQTGLDLVNIYMPNHKKISQM